MSNYNSTQVQEMNGVEPFEVKPNDRFLATVRSIRKEGVYIEMPRGGVGCISPRCWGDGISRTTALKGIKPGDKIEVVVRTWDPRTRAASLVLPGYENLPRNPKAAGAFRWHKFTPKESFCPEPAGTTFIYDLANILGRIPLQCIPNAKSAIESRFFEAGYQTLFYLDRGTAGWVSHVLGSEAAKDRFFGTFRENGNASYVGSYRTSAKSRKQEADLAILQTAAAIESSVACSRDGYADYLNAFPSVVTNRVRKFQIVRILNGSAVLTVEGAGCGAVVIPAFKTDAECIAR